MNNISTENVLKNLKAMIWERGWTYQALSEKLGMSESGLKKLMTNSDISLMRLGQICQVCEIDLTQLLSQSDQGRVQEVYLSPQQEQYLLRNPKILKFYWKIRVDEMSRSEFQKRYKIDSSETQKWLSGLEKIGLLKFSSKGQIEFIHQGLIRWNSESPLVKYLHQLWSRQLVDRVVERSGPSDFINLSGLFLDAGAVGELRQELLEVFEVYSKRSQRLKREKGTRRIGFLAAFTNFEFELD